MDSDERAGCFGCLGVLVFIAVVALGCGAVFWPKMPAFPSIPEDALPPTFTPPPPIEVSYAPVTAGLTLTNDTQGTTIRIIDIRHEVCAELFGYFVTQQSTVIDFVSNERGYPIASIACIPPGETGTYYSKANGGFTEVFQATINSDGQQDITLQYWSPPWHIAPATPSP